MQIDPKRAEAFCARPPEDVGLFLLFGPARSLVTWRLDRLYAAASEGSTPALELPSRVHLGAEQFKSSQQILAIEANSASLLGGKRFLIVREVPALALSKAVEALLTTGFDPQQCWIVIEAGELTKSSKLRKICEADKACAALPCYEEDAGALMPFLRQEAQARALNLSRDELELVLSRTGNDRALLCAALEKIELYRYDNPKRAGIEHLLDNAQEQSLNSLIDCAFSGKQQKLALMLERFEHNETLWQGLVWALFTHLTLLDALLAAMSKGQSAQAALAGIKPPVFWKRRAFVQQQLEWIQKAGGIRLISKLRTRLAGITLGVRGESLPVRAALAQYLLAVCLLYR